MGWYDRRLRRVRDLSCGDTRVHLEVEVRRLDCRDCGKVKREQLDFLADNLAISLNVIAAAHKAGVRKLLFLGSSCVYPREAPQPMRWDSSNRVR